MTLAVSLLYIGAQSRTGSLSQQIQDWIPGPSGWRWWSALSIGQNHAPPLGMPVPLLLPLRSSVRRGSGPSIPRGARGCGPHIVLQDLKPQQL